MNPYLKSLSTALISVVMTFAPGLSHAQSSGVSAGITLPKSQLKVGQQYYIAASGLNVRSSNSTTAKNVVGKLSQNDVVELFDILNEAKPLVQVKVISSVSVKPNVAPELFVSKDYLSEKPIERLASSKYFVIQNIATEKTRVYERCTATPDCPHTLIFEADNVVGRPEEGDGKDPKAYITWLGHSQIADWVKFYSDGAGNYPPWYTEGQDLDTIPSPISNSLTKMFGAKKWTTTRNGKSTVYGAFGWYAARLTPADSSGVNYQWMHGSIGWGKDGDKAIDLTRGFLINVFSNPGSHGCTRLANRSIAYLRHLLPVGTDIYRVYARESKRDSSSPISRYQDKYKNPGRWEYIMLTEGAQKVNGLTADAETIRNAGISIRKGVNFIEQGVYEFDRYPSVVGLDYTQTAFSGKSGDRYRVDSGNPWERDRTNFRGYFLVDEGRFINYQHPDEREVRGRVKVSGLPDFRNSVPEFLKTTGEHHPPEINYPKNDGLGGIGSSAG